MNPAFLELLSSCEPSTYDESSFIGGGGGHMSTFAVNHLGDIMIIASDGRLKHSNIRSHPRHRTTTDHQVQRQQLEDIDLHGLLCDEVAGFTHLEYNSNSDLLMWSKTAVGVIATNGVHHVHQKTDGLSSSFRYIKIWDKLQDNGELNGIIKATFHPLSPYHVVALFDNNTLQLVDYRSMDIQVIPLSKRFSSGAFTSFTFGPNIDWLKFTMLFLTTNGDVYTLCPIIPLGAVVPVSAVMELWDWVDQLVVDDDGYNRSGNDRYYLQYVQRYLTDIFGERSSHGLVGEVSPTDDDAIVEGIFIRAGESYENLHGDQLGISNYTPQLVGPIVIQRDSYEQLVGDDTGSNELKMSESIPHRTANDICVPGSPSSDTSLHPVGAPVVAISYSTGVVDVLVFDASQNSVISSWSHISPTWRCIDINKPNVASSTAMHTSLLLAETIRACPAVDVDDDDANSVWTLQPDPVLHHSLHVTNFRRGASYMISCSWLERIQDDISNEVSSSAGNTLRTYGHNNNNEEDEESPVTGDPILDHPSKCVPVFILPSNAPPDKRHCGGGGGDVSNESKHGTNTLKNNNNSSSSSSSMSREALIGMTVLCDALLGHVVLFRCASGLVTAINLTVHLRLSELQESLSRSRGSSEKLPIKEELSRAVSAEQIRWRHASECIRRVEEGLKGMPSSFEEAGSVYSLTPQSSSQNKKVLLEVAEKVERDVLIPINELAQSTAFSFQLLQEAYKSQTEVLEGSIDVDADSASDGKPHGIGNDSLSIGLKNLIGRLNASHGELRGRVGLIQDVFDRQKASLEQLVAKAMQKRNKLSSANSDSILQLREWSTVIAKMNEQLINLQSIAKSASTPTPTNRLTANAGMMYNPARSGLLLTSTSASVASPFSQSNRSPVNPLHEGSKMPLTSGMRMSSGVHHHPPSTRTPPPLNSVVARGSSSMSAVGLYTDSSRGLVSPMSVRSHASSRLGLGGLTTPSSPYTHDSHQTHYTSRAVASPASNRLATTSSAVTSNVTLQLTPSDQDICIQLLTSQTMLLEQAREELAILEERLHVLKESRDC